jgi:hypothetical protein
MPAKIVTAAANAAVAALVKKLLERGITRLAEARPAAAAAPHPATNGAEPGRGLSRFAKPA